MKTKKQIISLFSALTTVKVKGNAKFKYAAIKNLKLIESDIEACKKCSYYNNEVDTCWYEIKVFRYTDVKKK